jgi:hypothetical protein
VAQTPTLARWLIASGLATATACAGGAPLAPSPIIRPDAVIVGVGDTQLFSVENATVTGFTIASDAGAWTRFVRIDSTEATPNGIRLIAVERTNGGFLYLTAAIGMGRTPMVAVICIE